MRLYIKPNGIIKSGHLKYDIQLNTVKIDSLLYYSFGAFKKEFKLSYVIIVNDDMFLSSYWTSKHPDTVFSIESISGKRFMIIETGVNHRIVNCMDYTNLSWCNLYLDTSEDQVSVFKIECLFSLNGLTSKVVFGKEDYG